MLVQKLITHSHIPPIKIIFNSFYNQIHTCVLPQSRTVASVIDGG